MSADLPFHPLADAFPLMEGHAFDELVASIKANGLRHPVITLDGMILDGRNRYRACEAANVVPTFETFSGTDPISFVVDENLNRRHLTISQRAMAAAVIETFGDGRPPLTVPHGTVSELEGRRDDVARQFGIGKRTLQRAASVRAHGTPEQITAVERGEVTVNTMATQVKPKAHSRHTADGNAKRRATLQAKGQLWGQLRDAVNALTSLPLPSDVAAVARANDRAGLMDRKLTNALNWLKDFEHAWRNHDQAAA